ncbi:hypothetical protein JMJ35_008261 [Cladonia borealis]|uniref:Uncharacterized protein n=1 Tax=Cladonia borealis TaxID=184061 RepID=A0AA39V6V4_9LECA|nr:hypothetical protein JMJ35_008261 [Cladonia borealis]
MGQVQPATLPPYMYHGTEMNGPCKTNQGQQKAIEARQEADELTGSTAKPPQSWWQRQMLAQGPWDEINDPEFVEAFKSEPRYCPEKYFEGHDIPKLLSDLGNSGLVRHVLIENNIIGLAGAAALAHWTLNNPGNIETWFLAGNCINATILQRLVGAWIFADNVTNIWLRRNPLGSESAYMLSILIKNSPKLRTLDLDQTELGDQGVADLFGALLPLQPENVLKVKTPVPAPNGDSEMLYRVISLNPIWIKKRAWGEESPLRTVRPPTTINLDELTYKSTVALRNVYLDAVGASAKACWSIGLYLSHSLCPIESLYLCNNPLGHVGAMALANGLARNQSLLRLNLASCGLNNDGVIAILGALKAHIRLRSLGLSQSHETSKLGSRYNYFDDGIKDALKAFIVEGPKSVRLLDLGDTAMSVPAIDSLAVEVARSDSLVVFYAGSIHGHGDDNVLTLMERKLDGNRQHHYGMDDTTFSKTERRWLMEPKDADIINSACSNRNFELASMGNPPEDVKYR